MKILIASKNPVKIDATKEAFSNYFEDIEILRFLEWDAKIRMIETSPGSLAVDIPSDIIAVESALKNQTIQNS